MDDIASPWPGPDPREAAALNACARNFGGYVRDLGPRGPQRDSGLSSGGNAIGTEAQSPKSRERVSRSLSGAGARASG
eukprot:978509-Pyramimonas_sp.AAC.1